MKAFTSVPWLIHKERPPSKFLPELQTLPEASWKIKWSAPLLTCFTPLFWALWGSVLSRPKKTMPPLLGTRRHMAQRGHTGRQSSEQLLLQRWLISTLRLRVKLKYHAGDICLPALHLLPAVPHSCILMVIPQSVLWQLGARWHARSWQGLPFMNTDFSGHLSTGAIWVGAPRNSVRRRLRRVTQQTATQNKVHCMPSRAVLKRLSRSGWSFLNPMRLSEWFFSSLLTDLEGITLGRLCLWKAHGVLALLTEWLSAQHGVMGQACSEKL